MSTLSLFTFPDSVRRWYNDDDAAVTKTTNMLMCRRGMAVYAGRDVNKLKSKGGKWKYVISLLRSPLPA